MSNTEPDLTNPGLALDAVSTDVDLGPERVHGEQDVTDTVSDHFAGADQAHTVELPPLPEPAPEPIKGIAPEADG